MVLWSRTSSRANREWLKQKNNSLFLAVKRSNRAFKNKAKTTPLIVPLIVILSEKMLAALYHSRLRWFAFSSCKAKAVDLPPSPEQHRFDAYSFKTFSAHTPVVTHILAYSENAIGNEKRPTARMLQALMTTVVSELRQDSAGMFIAPNFQPASGSISSSELRRAAQRQRLRNAVRSANQLRSSLPANSSHCPPQTNPSRYCNRGHCPTSSSRP